MWIVPKWFSGGKQEDDGLRRLRCRAGSSEVHVSQTCLNFLPIITRQDLTKTAYLCTLEPARRSTEDVRSMYSDVRSIFSQS